MDEDDFERVYMVAGFDAAGDIEMFATNSAERALVRFDEMDRRLDNVSGNEAVLALRNGE